MQLTSDAVGRQRRAIVTKYTKELHLRQAAGLILLLSSVSLASFPVPVVEIDLDRPSSSWPLAVHTILDLHGWNNSFGPVFEAHNASLFNKLSDSQWAQLESSVRQNWPQNSIDLEAIAGAFAAAKRQGKVPADVSVTFRYLSGWVWFHELAHSELADFKAGSLYASPPGCAGLVATQEGPWRTTPGLGDVVHVRNMDQSPAPLRNITLQLNFVRDGNLQYRATGWYWHGSGLMTAVRKGAASLEENWRFANVSSADIFRAAGNGTVPQLFVFRRLLQGLPLTAASGASDAALEVPPSSFDEVMQRLEELRVAAPMYVIAGGSAAGEGAVVVVQTGTAPACVQRIGNWSCGAAVPPVVHTPYDAATEAWMVAQTNYDPWEPDPPGDARRTAALRILAASGPSLGGSIPGLMAAAGTYPIHNPDTAYTAVMRAGDGSLSAWVREALVPA